nr:hypothetical protein [Tanacetum cinerariifolium]
MINSIKNGEYPLPVVAQVSLAGTAPNATPTLKDLKFWTPKEKKTRKINHLARSLLIQGLSNDIYSLIDSNDTVRYLWMLLKSGCVVLMINDLKKCGYKKDNYALYNILKQNQSDMNDTMGYKKKAVMVTSDPLALVAEKTKITALLAKAFNRKKYYAKPTNNNLRTSSASSLANKKPEYVKKEDKKADEKKRDMSKTKMLLAKKDGDEQVLLTEDQAWLESSSDSDQEINANMVLMAKMKKVLSDSEESSSSAEETISEVHLQLYDHYILFWGKKSSSRPPVDAPKLKAKGDIEVFVGYSKESAAFRGYNKRTQKTHESVNLIFDEISEMASKQFGFEPGLSNLDEMGKSLNPSVSQVSDVSKKDLEDLFYNFYNEYFDSSKITKSPTTNVETFNNEIPSHEGEVFHEVSKSFQEESSSSSLNAGIQQSPEEFMVPSSNT